MKKIIFSTMIITGLICIMSAIGNDDLYGLSYPIYKIILWNVAGLLLIGIGAKGLENGTRKDI